jgi:hypothetical protein
MRNNTRNNMRNIEESKFLINVTHEDAWLNINKKIKLAKEESKIEEDMPYEPTEFKIKIEEQQPNDTLSNNEEEEELD